MWRNEDATADEAHEGELRGGRGLQTMVVVGLHVLLWWRLSGYGGDVGFAMDEMLGWVGLVDMLAMVGSNELVSGMAMALLQE